MGPACFHDVKQVRVEISKYGNIVSVYIDGEPILRIKGIEHLVEIEDLRKEGGIASMTFDEKVEAIKWYQSQSRLHPLTCGIDSKHKLLEPHSRSDSEFYIYCPSCRWRQQENFIPQAVWKLWLEHKKARNEEF